MSTVVDGWQTIDLRTDPDEARYEGNPADLVDAVGFILSLADRPAWTKDGACRDHSQLPPSAWFPERGDDVRPAKAVCGLCLVREECLAHALEHGDKTGIWGGLSERERRRLRRQRALARRPGEAA